MEEGPGAGSGKREEREPPGGSVRPAPLDGLRVLVTRAEDQGQELSEELARLGAEVLWIPAIRTVPVAPSPEDSALVGALADFEWTAFTSPNAVRYFLGLLGREGRGIPPGIRVAAVGAATEKALAGAGISVSVLPPEATGKSLAEHLKSMAPPSRILLPRGRKGREEVGDLLAAAAWEVVPILCYDTLPAEVSDEAAAEMARGVDAALFASPSAAKNLWAGLGGKARDGLRRAVVIPIGPTTAEALRALGLEPTEPPEDHSVPGLVGALLRALGRGSAPP